jgi:hypothetical protein
MNAQIVFVTLFLGIVAGQLPIDLQVSGPVKSIRLLIGGEEVGRIAEPPWHTSIDVGTDLTPRELVAVGYDAEGKEIARAAQTLNLPRPLAEFEIAIDGDVATLTAHHLMGLRPIRASIDVDGKPVAVDKLRAKLPKFNPDSTHVIDAEVTFADGFVARRELVLQGAKSYAMGTQLTPVLVRETAEQHPASWDACFSQPGGETVRTTTVETPEAMVIVVRAPDPHEAGSVFNPVLQELNKSDADVRLPDLLFAGGTTERILWPVAEKHGSDSLLFIPSMDYDGSKQEFKHFLMSGGPEVDGTAPLRFADAVAVAGIRAITGAQRRAVVLILSYKPDASMHSPQSVRRYLDALGVPLFVWSPMSEAPKSAGAWGEVENVSTVHRLGVAFAKLRRALAEQRIAWVNVDPLAALRLQANAKCGIETVARIPR